MKNKIAKKLIFSAVALGASVLTLTTTTYAWYVQNNTVTATDIQAATASNQAGSLFISKDARPRTDGDGLNPIAWGPTVKFGNEDFTAQTKTDLGNERNQFTPVTYYNGTEASMSSLVGKFIDVNATVPAEGKVLVANFWLLSNKSTGVTVQPTLTVQNTTTTKAPQTAYAAIPSATDGVNLVDEEKEFWVDAVQALRMRVQTSTWDSTLNDYSFTGGIDEFYDVLEIAKKPKAANETTFSAYELATTDAANTVSLKESDLITETSGLKGAHAYYKKFVGKEPAAGWSQTYSVEDTAAAQHAGKMNTFAVTSTPIKVTVTIWLDGTDAACFDSCSGQTFNFGFDFTVTTAA